MAWDITLKNAYPRLYQIASNKDASIAQNREGNNRTYFVEKPPRLRNK